MRALLDIAITGAWLFLAGFPVLWTSHVLFRTPVRTAIFVAGYLVVALVARGGPPAKRLARFRMGIVAGLLSALACIGFANLAWPLRNPGERDLLTGLGALNYLLLPWAHALIWTTGLALTRRKR